MESIRRIKTWKLGEGWRLPKRITALFGASLALLCGVGIVAYEDTFAGNGDAAATAGASRNVAALTMVIKGASIAEIFQRGFLLTGQERFLPPFRMGKRLSLSGLETLHHGGPDNMRLAFLERCAAVKFHELEAGIAIRRRHGLAAAQAAVAAEGRKDVMEDIEHTVSALQDEENGKMARRMEERSAARGAALLHVAVCVLLDFGLLCAVYLLYRRDTLRREDAERRLRLFQLRLTSITDAANDAIITSDAAGDIVFWSRAAEEMFGYPEMEALGRPLGDVMPTRFRAAHARGLARARRVGGYRFDGKTVELCGLRKDGTEFPAELSMRTTETPEGLMHCGIVRDITERKRAEAALRESEHRFRAALESLEEGFVIHNANGTIQLCNPSAERIMGLTADQMVGRTSADPRWRSVREDGLPTEEEDLASRRALRTGLPQRNQITGVERPNGELVWISVTSMPLFHNGEATPYSTVTTFTDITERRLAEEKLRRSEAGFRLLFAGNPVPMWVYDMETLQFMEVNDAAIAHYGYTRDEFLSMRGADIRPPEDAAKFAQAMHDLDRGARYKGEWRHILKDGRTIEVEITSQRMETSTRLGCLVVAQDITERKSAEKNARQAMESQRTIIATVGEGITFSDETGHFEVFNARMEEITGFTMEEANAAGDFSRLIYPDDGAWGQAMKGLTQVLERGSVRDLETTITARDGTKKTLLVSTTILPSPTGRMFLTAYHDITQRQRAEEALRASDEQFRAMFQYSRAGVSIVGLDTRYMHVNPAYCEMFGYSSEELLAGDITLITRPEDRESDGAFVRGLLSGKVDTNGREKRYVHKSGREVWGLLSVAVVRGADGLPLHMVSQIQDITARKKYEQRLEEQTVLAIEAQVALEAKQEELLEANGKLELLATHDGLTGLKNRRTFQERLEEEVCRATRYNTPLSLLMLDVDAFKQYNDAFGHLEGDAVLCTVSRTLEAQARTTDMAARYGGEEFAVLLPNTDGDGARRIAERCRAAVEAVDWTRRRVTASFGSATLDLETNTATALLSAADAALYRAKAAGRNRACHALDTPAPVAATA